MIENVNIHHFLTCHCMIARNMGQTAAARWIPFLEKTTGQRQHIKLFNSISTTPSIHILVVTWYPLHIGSVDSPIDDIVRLYCTISSMILLF